LSTVQTIAKNIIFLLVGQILTYIISLFCTIYIARSLGPSGFGVLSFALAFTGIFVVFGDIGLQQLSVREIAREKSLASKYLANISLLKIPLAIITFSLIALTINLMGYPRDTVMVVYLIGLSVILTAFAMVYFSIFQAFEKMEYQSIGQLLSITVILGGIFIAIKYNFTVIGFASLYLLANIVLLIYCLVVIRIKFPTLMKGSAGYLEFDGSFWVQVIKQALPFGLIAFLVGSYLGIDSVILSAAKGNEAVGWYNAAYKIVLALVFIPSCFFVSLFPIMSKLYKSSVESLKLVYERSLKYMLILSIPIGVGITILASRIVTQVFGVEYEAAAIALQILVWSTVLIYIGSAFAFLMYSIDRQTTVVKVMAVTVTVNVILNIILIPAYSYVGASIASVISNLATLLMLGFIMANTEYRLGLGSLITAGKALLSCLVMLVFIRFASSINLFLLVSVSALIYFLVLYGVKGFDRQDIAILKRLFTRESIET
jgi:O-antigen/teichoic acid export membrane protein